jgi:hypothetical protein
MPLKHFLDFKVTRKRIAVTSSATGTTDLYFPQVPSCVPIPARYLGTYRVPLRYIKGSFTVDGEGLWAQFEDWTARGFKLAS